MNVWRAVRVATTRRTRAGCVFAAALAGLPGMTPVRLARLLDGFEPAIAWHAVAAGTHPCDSERRFESAASSTDVPRSGMPT